MFRQVYLGAILMLAMAASLAAQGIVRPARKGPPPGARAGRPAAVIERWNNMTPEQRRKALDRVPPERRRRIEEQLEQYSNLSPEERRALRFRWEMFSQLPPERQDEARRLFRQFSQLPQARQSRLREEFQQLRAMPEPERAARLESSEFREAYTVREQRFLGAFARMLAPSPPADATAEEPPQ
jgi:hypothetical protein